MDDHEYNVRRAMSQSERVIVSKIDSLMERLIELSDRLIAIEQRIDQIEYKIEPADECDCPDCQESRD